MTSLRGWSRAALCVAGMAMSGGAWLGGLQAQQAPAAPAAEVRGNVERGRYLVESVAMCGECHSTRDQAVALLTQPTIDRAALESLRASQLAVAEQASKRLAQALADMADVLTPDQRKAIAEHMARRHGPRG